MQTSAIRTHARIYASFDRQRPALQCAFASRSTSSHLRTRRFLSSSAHSPVLPGSMLSSMGRQGLSPAFLMVSGAMRTFPRLRKAANALQPEMYVHCTLSRCATLPSIPTCPKALARMRSDPLHLLFRSMSERPVLAVRLRRVPNNRPRAFVEGSAQ